MKTKVRLAAAALALGLVSHAPAQQGLIHDVDISPLHVTVGPIADCLPQPSTDPISIVRTRSFQMGAEESGRILIAIFASLPALSDPPVPATPSRFGIADQPADPSPAGDNPDPPYFHIALLRAGYSYSHMDASPALATASREIEVAAADLRNFEATGLHVAESQDLRVLRARLASAQEREIPLGNVAFGVMIPREDRPGSGDEQSQPEDEPPAQTPAPAKIPIWYPFFLTRLARGNAAGTDALTLAYSNAGRDYVVIVNTNTDVTIKVYWRAFPAAPSESELTLQPLSFAQFMDEGGQVTLGDDGPLGEKPDLACLADRAHAAYEAAVAQPGDGH